MKDVISDIARNVGADAAASVAPAIPEEERTFLRPGASPGGGGKGDAALVLRSAEFRRGREHVWRALDEMIDRVEKRGVETLSAEEVRRLPLLYRATMSSLSVARHIALDRNLLLYLENLALRAYLVVYGPRSGVLVCLKDFLRGGFPRAVRSMLPHLAVALAALLCGALAGYLLVRVDPDTFGLLVPGDLAGGRGPGSTREELLHEELFAPWPGFVHAFVVFADTLFRHNAMVGLLCFGLGFALGVPTLILLLCNGLMLGAFLALHVERGLGVEFMAWLSIHGVTEILAVLLCAAAGLVVAEKIVFPGRLSRLENLARHGRAAASAAAGAVLLFFAAGILEGGFRQLIASTPGRFGVALLTGAWWLFYFSRCGRGGDDGKLR